MTKRNYNELEDVFMKTFKYYKSNKPKPSFDKIVFSSSNVKSCSVLKSYKNVKIDNYFEEVRLELLGLRNFSEWDVLSFSNHPGLIFIKNPFTSQGQRYWIQKCLEQYTRKPNKTNIDIEIHLESWWAECYKNKQCDEKLLKKLRWTTLGYHHNWDTKVYSEDNKTDVPNELSKLCDIVSKSLGFKNFRTEAAIINYYHMGSTLSAHTDHSEVNLDAPLFSFSFGQSAVFLIGGPDKSVEPTAIMLNSGDIIVMSKEARLCYHAVPKIVKAQLEPWNDVKGLKTLESKEALNYTNVLTREINRNIDEEEWREFSKYVDKSRININVRQVLNEKQNSL